MPNTPLPTLFAPAERADGPTLRAQHETVAGDPLAGPLLDSFPEGAAVLNRHRQIVFANEALAAFVCRPRDALVGLRLGEVFGCVHAAEGPSGCGTTDGCRYCGATRAAETSRLNDTKEVEECRIPRAPEKDPPALDLRVWARPVTLNGDRFTVIALRDISDEKRRQSLERIFFHDLMNLAGGLRCLLQTLPDLPAEEAVGFERMALSQVEQLVEEISCQRDLGAAERGELAVNPRPVAVRDLLERICFLYRHHPVAEGKTLTIEAEPAADLIQTDPVHLRRVLGNLIKNALEATAAGETVSVRYGPGPAFAVNNPAVMSDAVRAQIFQRSFTTKSGPGRGLGSYSVKLLTERYLRGRVEFRSVAGEGTTFRVLLPAAEVGTHPPPKQEFTPPPELAGLSVLLAEDNAVNRLALSALLRKAGVEVSAVVNGAEALEAVRGRVFDAVFLDVEMPVMGGLEAAAAVRALEAERGGHVPMIALTGHDSEADRRRCLDAGMDDHLSKPVTPEALYGALGRARHRKAGG